MYHSFHDGQSISSQFGVSTIVSHVDGLVWGFEVKRHSDGRIAWLSADEMFPLRENLLPGDMIGAHDHDGVEHIGMVTVVEGDLKALFASGEHTVSVRRIMWVVPSDDAVFA